MNKIYLGYKGGAYHLFRSATEPTRKSHGEQYDFVFGAFRTKRGGEWAMKHALGNPHAQTVSECERLSKEAE